VRAVLRARERSERSHYMNAAVAVGGTVAVAGAATVYYCSKGDKGDNSHQMLPSGGGSTIGGTVPAAAAARRTVIFDSVAAAESWVTENGWTCLLCVGNSAAGYTEQSFQASQARATQRPRCISHNAVVRPVSARRAPRPLCASC
jgi:hypothetical protein